MTIMVYNGENDSNFLVVYGGNLKGYGEAYKADHKLYCREQELAWLIE